LRPIAGGAFCCTDGRLPIATVFIVATAGARLKRAKR
jgi:hypothetical protein